MIVKYSDDSCEREVIVKGSGSQVNIPGNATDISVRFRICGFSEYSVMWRNMIAMRNTGLSPQYLMFSTFPHLLLAHLEESLYYVAVMKATDEHDEECNIID